MKNNNLINVDNLSEFNSKQIELIVFGFEKN